jgi:hypothetical protein
VAVAVAVAYFQELPAGNGDCKKKTINMAAAKTTQLF